MQITYKSGAQITFRCKNWEWSNSEMTWESAGPRKQLFKVTPGEVIAIVRLK
jgi:hypothetical protein